MTAASRVSVALCTYNGARFLREQLDSIASQTRPVGEIVVSDDGSTDTTRELVEDFARQAPVPVRLLPRGPRLGVTANFARALAATDGDLIALSDQDDVWHPRHVERLARLLESDSDLLLAHSDARLVDASGRPLGLQLLDTLGVGPRQRAEIIDGRAFDLLLHRNVVTGATVMLRRELVELATPIPESWVHDEWLAIVASAAGRVGLVDEPLVDYRQHGANEIGVTALSTRDRLRRLVEPSGARLSRLAEKWEALASRAVELGFSPTAAERVRLKASFESARLADPAVRPLRIVRILGRLLRGEYGAYASQGHADAARDLFSPR